MLSLTETRVVYMKQHFVLSQSSSSTMSPATFDMLGDAFNVVVGAEDTLRFVLRFVCRNLHDKIVKCTLPLPHVIARMREPALLRWILPVETSLDTKRVLAETTINLRQVCLFAGKEGNTRVLEHIMSDVSPADLNDAICVAIRHSHHFGVLVWIQKEWEHRKPSLREKCDLLAAAAARGNVDALSWLEKCLSQGSDRSFAWVIALAYSRPGEDFKRAIARVAYAVILSGSVQTIDWLAKRGFPLLHYMRDYVAYLSVTGTLPENMEFFLEIIQDCSHSKQEMLTKYAYPAFGAYTGNGDPETDDDPKNWSHSQYWPSSVDPWHIPSHPPPPRRPHVPSTL